MPDNKQKCKNRHVPPTGTKCPYVNNVQTDADELPNGIRGTAVASVSLSMDQADPGGQWIQEEILAQLKKMSDRLDTSQHTGEASTSSSRLGKLSRDTNFTLVI